MPFFEVFENFSYHLYDIGCLSMIYTLKYAKSESNFDTDFEHPTFRACCFHELLVHQGVLLWAYWASGCAAMGILAYL